MTTLDDGLATESYCCSAASYSSSVQSHWQSLCFRCGADSLGSSVMRSRHITIILAQKESLSQKHSVLETQTGELRAAAADMEAQARALEVQTRELETTVEELRASELRQRRLADESAVLARRLAEAQRVAKIGYWEIDSATGEVFWSDEMYAIGGLDPSIHPPPTDEFISRVHPDDRQRLMEVANRAIESSTEFTEHYRLAALDGAPGAWRSIQANARLVVNEQGERKLVGTVQDVTERVVLENQLRRSQKMEAIGQLAGGIAHDFNNLLTVIDGYSSLLLSNQPPDSSQRTDIQEIRNATAARVGTDATTAGVRSPTSFAAARARFERDDWRHRKHAAPLDRRAHSRRDAPPGWLAFDQG